MHISTSIHNIPIEIPDDRWKLICEGHPETSRYREALAETIEDPDIVYEGTGNRSVAVKKLSDGKYLTVIYNEKTGKLVTVFIIRNLMQFDEINIVWKKNT